jgi:hypothetical protein
LTTERAELGLFWGISLFPMLGNRTAPLTALN